MNLLTKVILILAVPAVCGASPYEEAMKKAAEAAFIQLEGQRYLDKFAEEHLPKEYRTFIEKWGFYGKIIVEGRLELKWTF